MVFIGLVRTGFFNWIGSGLFFRIWILVFRLGSYLVFSGSGFGRFFSGFGLVDSQDLDSVGFSGLGFGRFFQRVGSGFSGSGFRDRVWFFYGQGSGIKKGF